MNHLTIRAYIMKAIYDFIPNGRRIAKYRPDL